MKKQPHPPRSLKRDLAAILGTDEGARVEAAKRLASRAAAFDDLRRILRHEERAAVRQAVTFALSWHGDRRSWPLFLRLLADDRESSAVRGQAAEGLAYNFRRKRRGSAGYEAALRVLVAALESDSVEVRYYCVFALGASGDDRMLPVLRRLRRDRTRSKRFVGTIGAEAREAIESIEMRLAMETGTSRRKARRGGRK